MNEGLGHIQQINKILRRLRGIGYDILRTFGYVRRPPEIAMLKIDYEQYWRIRGSHSLQPRYPIIAKVIEPGSTVLDIGCGDGLLLQYLTETRSISGYGIDISHEAIKLAKARGIEAIAADILDWEIKQEYDYIIISEVLEHLVNAEEVINKVQNRFRKALLVSIPNIGYYQHRLRLLFGRFPLQWGWHPAEHLRFWTVLDFVEWIEQLGLIVVNIQSSNGLPVLHRYWPNLFGNQIVFVIKPHPKRREVIRQRHYSKT